MMPKMTCAHRRMSAPVARLKSASIAAEYHHTGGVGKPVGLAALELELERGMRELRARAKPVPYFIAYEVHDRNETVISASYGALVQTSVRRSRILDADVRVGDYDLDST